MPGRIPEIGRPFCQMAGRDHDRRGGPKPELHRRQCPRAGALCRPLPGSRSRSDTIERCYEVTHATLRSVFHALYAQRIVLEQLILKTNMVIAGKKCPRQASVSEVAEETVRCLRNTVPAAVAGIVFLSGGQSARLATAHLNAMNSMCIQHP